MSLLPDTDTTDGQLMEPTIDTDAVMAAAAAADAILCSPTFGLPSAADGQILIS